MVALLCGVLHGERWADLVDTDDDVESDRKSDAAPREQGSSKLVSRSAFL